MLAAHKGWGARQPRSKANADCRRHRAAHAAGCGVVRHGMSLGSPLNARRSRISRSSWAPPSGATIFLVVFRSGGATSPTDDPSASTAVHTYALAWKNPCRQSIASEPPADGSTELLRALPDDVAIMCRRISISERANRDSSSTRDSAVRDLYRSLTERHDTGARQFASHDRQEAVRIDSPGRHRRCLRLTPGRCRSGSPSGSRGHVPPARGQACPEGIAAGGGARRQEHQGRRRSAPGDCVPAKKSG